MQYHFLCQDPFKRHQNLVSLKHFHWYNHVHSHSRSIKFYW